MNVVETLRSFARKESSADAVMRALSLHEGFYAPVAELAKLGIASDDPIVDLGDGGAIPAGELWLFTARDLLEAAGREAALGAYAGPFDGVTMLARLGEADFARLKINPVVELETFWSLGSDAFPIARSWARAIEVERSIARRSEEGGALRMAETMRRYDGYQVLVHPNDAIVTAMNVGGLEEAALVFTAPDCAERGVAALGGPKVRRVTLGAEQLFTVLPKTGTNGWVVNVSGPGAQLIAKTALCDAILAV